MSTDVRDAALAAYAAGLAVLPPREDGTKAPLGEWKSYQTHPPDLAALEGWYGDGRRNGLGVLTGRVSGDLELLDFDNLDIHTEYRALAFASGLGDLVQRIEAGYVEATPKGVHWLYRCAALAGSTKLARREKPEHLRRDHDDKIETLIETKGEGGFVIVAPSHGGVHESREPYRLLSGGFGTIATISPEERRSLLDLARCFDELPKPTVEPPGVRAGAASGDRPGDEFNARIDWEEVLAPHGWSRVYRRGVVEFWRRPGKKIGISASTNFGDSDLLYVFTTSSLFESERGYDKFGAYAVLAHSGDFAAAARALRAQGYGKPSTNGHRPTAGPVGHSEEAVSRAFPRTDAGNGELFASLYADIVRYDHKRSRWLEWARHWWEVDSTERVTQLGKLTARHRYFQAATLDDLNERQLESAWAVKSESRARIEATFALGRTEAPIADSGADWDSDPLLLGVENGVLTLSRDAHQHKGTNQ